MKEIQGGMTAAQVSVTIMGNFSEVSAEADRAKTMAAAEEARAKGAEQGLTAAVAQNAEKINILEGNSATKAELNAEAERAQSAEELISQQAEQNFRNFSDLGVEESAKIDGYEIALTKKTNTAEKTKVKVPVYDMQNPSATPVGLVDEIFVEDMKAEAKKMVDAEAERAKAAEGEIRGSVESLGEDLNAASEDIGKLEVAIEAETSRAQAAEQALSVEITEAENRVDERVTEVRDSLDAEVQARSAAVADLEANTGISEYAAFDAAVGYAVGDVVKYEGRLYRFTADHAAGEWIGTDVEKWSERKEVEGKITELAQEVDDLVVDGTVNFAICDEKGNNIIEFKEGGVATKEFNSRKTPSIVEENNNDFAICDEKGNNIIEFKEGEVITKEFNSRKTPSIAEQKNNDFSITDESGNVLVSFSDGGIKTKKFDSLPRQFGLKKIGYIGDSITAGVANVPKDCCYPAVIARQMGWKSVNYGIAGTGICTNYPSGANNNFISRIPSMVDDLDAVVVFGGTNDWGVGDGIPIGNMGDTTAATFYGGMYLLLTAIFNKYPNSKKLFLTPLRRNYTGSDAKNGSGDLQNAAGATLGEYVEVIKIMCARWSVPVLDMYEESGLPFDLSANLVPIFTRGDGLHPNAFCHLSIIAPMIEIKLTKLFNII